ncbi:hypothetical protein INQ51_06200 [Maribellus sp. CM-23]|uniref:hypothetical protein n=1 Tax=Maribellus sp. CM-23 TaxID=2781026 RepID=UPI001F2CCD67|nr:hypothetical protein [Maribellus sp. CM-23]MCE4563897.1 hypothetical protein [Maribellus sp. CM-23]
MRTNKYQMWRGLSKTDRKVLRNQYINVLGLCVLVFVLATVIGVTIYELFFDLNPDALHTKMMIYISVGTLILSIMLYFLISHKYYRDLQFNEKIQLTKTLMGKYKTADYAAPVRGNSMSKTYTVRFEFLVDDIKFNVDKELFERCTEGDKLIFNYALKSHYLLSIEKAD